MVNGQNPIPEAFLKPVLESNPQPTFEAQQAAVFSASLDAQYYTPELQPGPYHFIKEIEDRLDSYRYTAIEIEEAHKHSFTGLLKGMKSLIIAPKPLIADYIEKERVVGGHIWDNQKEAPDHEISFYSYNHEWFFGWSDSKSVALQDSAVRYVVTDDEIYKLYKGLGINFTPGEKESFMNAVRAYEVAVREKIYVFDDELVKLNTEDPDELDALSELNYLDNLAKRDDEAEDAKKDDFGLAA